MTKRKKLILATTLVVVTVGLVDFAGVVFANFFSGFTEFEEQAQSTIGMTQQEAVAVMGRSSRAFSGADYLSNQRSGIIATYAPDPPDIDADVVLANSYANSMALLFVKDRVVIEVYVGRT